MALALLIAGMALAAAGYASARIVDPGRWTARALRTLFWIGAPASGIVATRTDVHAGLVIGLVAALVLARADWLGRARAFAKNPYLICVSAGYALDAAGVGFPPAVTDVGRTVLLLSTLPAFAAVGAVLAGHRLRVDAPTIRL